METDGPGRPSLATERRAQIIEATLRVFAVHGINGVTLERIAAQAGMARGHVRHYMGNRDAIILEAARQFYYQGGDTFFPASVTTADEMLEYLFSDEYSTPLDDDRIVFDLVIASRTDPDIGEIVDRAYGMAQREIEGFLRAAAPSASGARISDAAYGILSNSIGNAFLAGLQPRYDRPDVSKAHSKALIDGLLRAT